MKITHKLALPFLSILLGYITTWLLHVPIVGAIIGLFTALPLTIVFPYLGKTGEHVDVGPFWMIVTSDKAWFMYTSYYAFIWLVVISLYLYFKSQE